LGGVVRRPHPGEALLVHFASGNGGNKIYVIPQDHLVVAVTGLSLSPVTPSPAQCGNKSGTMKYGSRPEPVVGQNHDVDAVVVRAPLSRRALSSRRTGIRGPRANQSPLQRNACVAAHL
jgi:hypothetical protein